MIRLGSLSSLFVLFVLSVVASPARAGACPIIVTGFALEGRSTTAVAYRLRLGAHDAASAYTFAVTGADGKGADLTLAAGLDVAEALFAWPRSDLQSVWVKGFEPPGAHFTPCTSQPVKIRDVSADPTTVVFATGTLPLSHQLLPVDPSEPSRPVFVHEAQAEYPKDAARAGASGRVDVLVDVTAEGKPQNAVVASSSQFPPLDEAAVAATLASSYKPPEINGRPAEQRYLVPFVFTLPGTKIASAPDTKCHAWITRGWLIGLDRTSGENLYEIGLSADRRDVSAVDISLQKGDLAPPVTFSRLDWQRQPDGAYATRVFAASGGDLAGSLRLESADLGSQTLVCAPFTIVTWDHSAGRLNTGTRPTAPPAGIQVQPTRAASAAKFQHKVWPAYPRSASGDRLAGMTMLVVETDGSGRPQTTDIFRSSGDDALDAAASDAAMHSVFRATAAPATYVTWYVFRPTLTMGAYLP
ncbi:MAG: energy transducer TonB [Candidatus Eremiobacteraeota bacterium]|nr:energy transducer TonB [Candidatus Eremiobacteraeota bacterium]